MSENESQQKALTTKQHRAIKALLTEPTIKAAAEKARVAEATLHRWLNDPVFSLAYRDARGRLLETTLTRLQQSASKAVDTLDDVMDSAITQPGARVSAAKAVLEMTLKAREVLEVEERLRALEAKIEAGPPGGKRKL